MRLHGGSPTTYELDTSRFEDRGLMSSSDPLSPFNALSFESRFASAQTNAEEPSEKAVYDDDYFQFGGRLG
jgi:hypothetical protein